MGAYVLAAVAVFGLFVLRQVLRVRSRRADEAARERDRKANSCSHGNPKHKCHDCAVEFEKEALAEREKEKRKAEEVPSGVGTTILPWPMVAPPYSPTPAVPAVWGYWICGYGMSHQAGELCSCRPYTGTAGGPPFTGTTWCGSSGTVTTTNNLKIVTTGGSGGAIGVIGSNGGSGGSAVCFGNSNGTSTFTLIAGDGEEDENAAVPA